MNAGALEWTLLVCIILILGLSFGKVKRSLITYMLYLINKGLLRINLY